MDGWMDEWKLARKEKGSKQAHSVYVYNFHIIEIEKKKFFLEEGGKDFPMYKEQQKVWYFSYLNIKISWHKMKGLFPK